MEKTPVALAASEWTRRKILAFGFVLLVLVVTFINTYLTAHILLSLKLTRESIVMMQSEGSGGGEFHIADSLFASTIKGAAHNPLDITSDSKIRLASKIQDSTQAFLELGSSKAKLFTRAFNVYDKHGNDLLGIDSSGLNLAVGKLKANGPVLSSDGGIVSQSIRSNAGENLSLGSPTSSLSLNGPQEVKVNSFGGAVKIEAHRSLQIGTARTKKVVLQGSSLLMPNLTQAHKPSGRGLKPDQIHYQLCSCQDGTLFIVAPNEHCVADYHVCAGTAK